MPRVLDDGEGIMLGHLSDAVAMQEFVGCDFDTALAIVKAAYEYDPETAAPDEPIAPTTIATIGNVVCGVPFGVKKKPSRSHETL